MKETKKQLKNQIVIYKAQEGPQLKVQMDGETAWLTQVQMAELFQRDQGTISRHISNVFNEGELKEADSTLKQANMQKTHIGLDKPTTYYNLDVVISVGYRVKSKRGTQFRIWATQRLRDYLVRGYAVNEARLKEEHDISLKELERTTHLFYNILEGQRAQGYEKELLKIITDYAHTWAILNKYDKDELKIEGVSKKTPLPLDYNEVKSYITRFKTRLVKQKQAGSLFGQEVGDKFKGVLGSIEQTFGGKKLYPSIEERAAHLLYFAVKDHPFADGNKRIGSLMFMLFLVANSLLINKRGERKINDSALAALTLLIAESKPQQKDLMVKLIVNLINRK